MRRKGKLVTWTDDKGFGFIEPFDGGSRVFVHISAFDIRAGRPTEGHVVTFDTGKDTDGRSRAVNAKLAGTRRATKAAGPISKPAIAFALAFIGAVGASVVLDGLAAIVLLAYTGLSFVTFFAYAIDKGAAQNGRWRTAESTLHILALFGGWPGALVAQQTLRHKSRKVSFRIAYWFTVAINIGALVWLHTADGQSLLDEVAELARSVLDLAV